MTDDRAEFKRKLTNKWIRPLPPPDERQVDRQERLALAEAFEAGAQTRLHQIRDQMLADVSAPLPTTVQQFIPWVLGALTRDVLNEYLKRVESDAANAPVLEGDE